MICEKCGQWIEDGSKVCTNCGNPVNVSNAQGAGNAANAQGQPGVGAVNTVPGAAANGMGGYAAQPMTKAEFYKHPNVSYARTQIRAAAIISYVVAGISLVLGGWWILLAGIYAVIYTFKYQGAWAEYLKTGVVKDLSPAGKKARK